MAYEVNASRLTRTVVRINSTVKNIEADKFSATLEELNTLNTKAERPDFKDSLDDFLNTNTTFQEAFRYEGAFGKWCHSESYDIDRSKKILDGLILAVGKRIDHLTAQKTAVQNKIKVHVGTLHDNNQIFSNHLCRNFEVTFNSLDEYFKYRSPQGQLNTMNNFVAKYLDNKPTKDQSAAITTMTQYVSQLTEIDTELESLTALQLQAAQALTDLERPWGGLFKTYLAQ